MKILNFGSLNIDFVYSVEEFVRPGETISSLKMERFCGGKGLNQSIALAKAGSKVYHAGCIGSDGEMLVEILLQNGVDVRYIKTVDVPSGHAIIQVDKRGQNSIILFGGANQAITPAFVDQVLEHFTKGDVVLLQNEINSLSYILDKAYEKELMIALNPSPMNRILSGSLLKKITYFILNEIEAQEITGKIEWHEIIEAMIKLYPNAKVVLTLGKKGAVYYDGERIYQNGIYDVDVADTTAAGDTFLGFFLASIASKPAAEALRLASIASSLAVSVNGASVSIPTLKTVEDAKLQEVL